MRALACLLLLLAACEPAGSGDPTACEGDESRCVDDRTIQHCVDGTWAEPQACEDFDEGGFAPVPTYCFESGFCGIGG